MISRLFLSGTALLAATLLSGPASADEFDATRLIEEPPLAAAADPSAPQSESSAQAQPGAAPAVPERVGPSKFLGIDLKIDGGGFRLGGRLAGSKGVSEAWVNGQVRGDGVTLDGRLKGQDGPPRDFKLNLDLLPGWVSTAVRLWRFLP